MKPVELYRLTMAGAVWTLTSSNRPITYGGEVYVPVAIGRGRFESKNEVSKSAMDVRLDLLHELSQILMSAYSEQVLGLTLFIQTSLGTDTVWKGRLSGLAPNNAALVMSFESVFTSLRRTGLRARYQKTCRHALYGRGCTLDPETFAINATATAVAAEQVTVTEAAAEGDGHYAGGMLRAPDGTLGYIIRHVGTGITLQRPLASLVTEAVLGDVAVKLYAGCDHTRAICVAKFNNLPNYGGFDWIPGKNPMGGSSIA